jgi:hypothetical protein
MRTIMTMAMLLTLTLGVTATATAQNNLFSTGTTITNSGTSNILRPGQMQSASQPFMNFFPSPGRLLNIITFTTTTPTNSTPASYLQQFGYQRARPAQ